MKVNYAHDARLKLVDNEKEKEFPNRNPKLKM